MLLFNELHCPNKTTEDTIVSFLKCYCIELLYYTHTHKREMMTFLSPSTYKKLAVLPFFDVEPI